MLNRPINNLLKKLGSNFIPIILGAFSTILVLTMLTSVIQKSVDYKEGQVATEKVFEPIKPLKIKLKRTKSVNWPLKQSRQNIHIKLTWRKHSMIVSIN